MRLFHALYSTSARPSAPAHSARNKLLNAIGPALADDADHLSAWFLHDPDPWRGNRIPHGELRRLARCIHERRKVELTIANEPIVTVRPLGLVLKAGSWQLVVAARGAIAVIGVDDLRATRITNRRFTPPAGFELAAFWREHTRAIS
jgi:predicted DNA-binding transcriptional regulator YafY